MKGIGPTVLGLILASAAMLLVAVGGCKSAERPRQTQVSTPQPHEPTDALAQSDAERAKAAIEQNQREMAGERRPHDPGRQRVVDQPRVGGRR